MNGSIVYEQGEAFDALDASLITDLKIDRILREINRDNSPFVENLFLRKPARAEDVLFRLACMQDLQRPDIAEIITGFGARYGRFREYLENSRKLSQPRTKQKWFLDAAVSYCESIIALRDELERVGVKSHALRRFLDCLTAHAETEEFRALHADGKRCAEQMDGLRYTVEVSLNQNRVKVSALRDECLEADNLFEKLAQQFRPYDLNANATVVPFPGVNMGTLETGILEQLQTLFPDAFSLLDGFCRSHPNFDTALADRFAEELQFYLCYIRYMHRLRQRGFCFAYPRFSAEKAVRIEGGYDLALAQDEAAKVSVADFNREADQSFLVTGPNHGGKTTYVCMVGQVLYLASLGLPAPCRSLETCYLRGLYTHFAKNEDLSTNAGRLKEELLRVKTILDRMPDDSLVIFNDLFASTTTYDALQMGRRILEQFLAKGCLFLFATHIGELARVCPGLVTLRAWRDEAAGDYTVEYGKAGQESWQNQWMDRYRLRRGDILERVKG